ncbi:MAG TPA: riboflavin synthase, partial [Steroidobacteraceae bacterium]|nr:riboflavin synthase [Steroidobacteraceae bacterium]
MFTGIVQDVGRIEGTTPSSGDIRLLIGHHLDTARLKIGDSVCVQGCCLTATHVRAHTFAADVSRETLALTTLGELTAGAAVNLEPALRAGDPLGGHLMSGHVDGVAQVLSISGDARSQRLLIGVPAP